MNPGLLGANPFLGERAKQRAEYALLLILRQLLEGLLVRFLDLLGRRLLGKLLVVVEHLIVRSILHILG